MIGNDDGLVTNLLSSLNHLVHTLVNSLYGSLNSLINTSVANHIAVSEVHHDEVIFVLLDGSHQLILYLVGAHLGLQVVSGNFRTGYQNTLLAFVGSLTTAIEEECHVCILLCLGCMQLLQTL